MTGTATTTEARIRAKSLVCEVLDEIGIEHTTSSEAPYVVTGEFSDGALEADIAVFCGQQFITIHLVTKSSPILDKLLCVYEAANIANRSLPVGGFEVGSDGRFRLKAGLLIDDATNASAFKQLLNYSFYFFKKFSPDILVHYKVDGE